LSSKLARSLNRGKKSESIIVDNARLIFKFRVRDGFCQKDEKR
jgi:hypothetical protein